MKTLLSISAICLSIVGSSKLYTLNPVEETQKDSALIAIAKVEAFKVKKILGGKLSEKVAEQGFSGAVEFCSLKAAEVTREASNSSLFEISRISEKPRNDKNSLSLLETRLLEGKTSPLVYQNRSMQIVYLPIFTESFCLNCHGNPTTEIQVETMKIIQSKYPKDKAIGFKEKDLRGWWKLKKKN